jgi:UDP-3-O-[3-hydroxymyristoyl] N-acetylglucosamine deacetylase
LYQTTVNSSFSFSGVGLHSGKEMPVVVSPADANTGVQFRRSDVQNCPWVRITPFNVMSTQLATTIQCGDFPISTIEHLMSAMYGLGVDNAYIEVGGPEIPILDGSALPIAKQICDVGILQQDAKRKYLVFERSISLEHDNKTVSAEASDKPLITFEIEYPHNAIGKQIRTLELSPETYIETVSIARTFGFKQEIEALWKMGLAKGGSIDNAIVVDNEEGILNPGGLRASDEFVSHKILDLIGDLALVGYRLQGHIYAVKSGHHVNNLFARKLLEAPNTYQIIELQDESQGYGHITRRA